MVEGWLLVSSLGLAQLAILYSSGLYKNKLLKNKRGMSPSTVDEPSQSIIIQELCPTGLSRGQSDGGIFSTEVSTSQITLV